MQYACHDVRLTLITPVSCTDTKLYVGNLHFSGEGRSFIRIRIRMDGILLRFSDAVLDEGLRTSDSPAVSRPADTYVLLRYALFEPI